MVTLEEVAEPDAEVSAVSTRLRAGERPVIRAMEPESAIIGSQRGGEETHATARLHLEPGIGALAQSQVCGAEVAGGVPLVGIGRQAKPHVVVEPVIALTADRDLVQLVETWRVFITRHQIGLVTAQAAVAYQQVVVSGRRERLGKQQSALQVINVVIRVGLQVDDPRDDAGGLVADFDAHALRACEDVLVVQEVKRSARPAEFLIARHCSRFGRESIHRDPTLAEAGDESGSVVRVHDPTVLVAHVVEALLPLLELRTAADGERSVVEPDAELVELVFWIRRFVARGNNSRD